MILRRPPAPLESGTSAMIGWATATPSLSSRVNHLHAEMFSVFPRRSSERGIATSTKRNGFSTNRSEGSFWKSCPKPEVGCWPFPGAVGEQDGTEPKLHRGLGTRDEERLLNDDDTDCGRSSRNSVATDEGHGKHSVGREGHTKLRIVVNRVNVEIDLPGV